MATKKQVYLNHIKRLEQQNRELVEMLLYERRLRIAAYAYYRKRLLSPLYRLIDMYAFLWMKKGQPASAVKAGTSAVRRVLP